jgi:hypothetical protein
MLQFLSLVQALISISVSILLQPPSYIRVYVARIITSQPNDYEKLLLKCKSHRDAAKWLDSIIEIIYVTLLKLSKLYFNWFCSQYINSLRSNDDESIYLNTSS